MLFWGVRGRREVPHKGHMALLGYQSSEKLGTDFRSSFKSWDPKTLKALSISKENVIWK